MLKFIFKRLLGAIPTLFVIISISFFMIRMAPGGPFDQERQLPPEVIENLNKAYHLDKPLHEQFVMYLKGILQGDFGPSFQYKDYSVTELIAQGFPVSLKIGGIAIILASLIGIFLGSLAALRQNTRTDYMIMSFSMTGITIPSFVMAPLMSLFIGVYLRWLPVGGWGTAKHAVMTIIALALPQIAYIARLTRASMIEVLRSNYIRTAKAKGLSQSVILFRHAIKGALLPVISYLGPATAHIITGSVVVEKIFGIPGIGRFFVLGALNRDYTLVMGVVVFYGMIIILLNLMVDILYGILDPKVRYE